MPKYAAFKNDSRGIAYVGILVFILVVSIITLVLAKNRYVITEKTPENKPTPITQTSTEVIPNQETSTTENSDLPQDLNITCDSLSLEFKNPTDTHLEGNVKLMCKKDSKVSEVLELTDMYTQHYHSNEIVNGNVYLIRRIGYDGYPDNDWTDELWVYHKNGKVTKIASAQGLDFRVSPTENYLAIDQHDNKFLVVNQKDAKQSEVDLSSALQNADDEPDLIGLNDTSVWIEERSVGPYLTAFHKINLQDNKVESYVLPSDIAGFSEYAFNMAKGLVAYTTYPAMFDVDTKERFDKSNAQISLNVYDLAAKKNTHIAKGTRTQFSPKWISDTKLEYTNPSGKGVLQITY